MEPTVHDVRFAIRAADSLPVKERRPAYAKAYAMLKQVEKRALSGNVPLSDVYSIRELVGVLSGKV